MVPCEVVPGASGVVNIVGPDVVAVIPLFVNVVIDTELPVVDFSVVVVVST